MAAARGRLTLRQLQVLHRHGDRSPLANVFLGSGVQAEQDEVARWHTRLPRDDALTALGERFALRDPSPPGKAMQHAPFGCLTEKGIAQMVERGETLAAFCAREGLALDALGERDVLVYCNAYLRTQLSVQALLTGLLRDHAHLAPRVHVLPLDRDMIHSYSVYPEISTLTMRQDTENERMIEREKEMAALKQELQDALPMYRKGGAPFYWTTCADYFTCRDAHELPLLPGTAPLRDATVRHMSFRYHQFYDHRRIRSLVAGQLMDHAMKEMHKIKAGDQEAKKLVVYSGHDVSILALLHAVDADITRAQSYWPPYASALSFELLEDEAAQWFVRVRINGEPLTLRELPSDTVALDGFADIVHDRIDIEDAFAGML